MDESELTRRIGALESKLDAVYASVEATRKIILWTAVATVAVFVIPLIGLMFVIPSFLASYSALVGI